MMQGTLQKLHVNEGRLYNSEDWQPYHFMLKDQILTFADVQDRKKTAG